MEMFLWLKTSLNVRSPSIRNWEMSIMYTNNILCKQYNICVHIIYTYFSLLCNHTQTYIHAHITYTHKNCFFSVHPLCFTEAERKLKSRMEAPVHYVSITAPDTHSTWVWILTLSLYSFSCTAIYCSMPAFPNVCSGLKWGSPAQK